MVLTIGSFDAALKELYPDVAIANAVYKKAGPFHALCKKDEEFYGKKAHVPVIYGYNAGYGADFAHALDRANNTSTRTEEYLIDRKNIYSLAVINGEALEASEKEVGAWTSALKVEVDGAIANVTRLLGKYGFGDGFGSMGTIASSGVDSITLANPEDVTAFEVGQALVFAASNDASALRDSGDSLEVEAVDRSNGVITFTENLSEIAGLQLNDSIFLASTRQDSATPERKVLTGLAGWIPATAPGSSDDFFGCNRSVDSRLYGHRINAAGTGISTEEALIKLSNLLGREGGEPDYAFVSYSRYSDLINSMGSKVVYEDVKLGQIGFRGVKIITDVKDVTVLPDRNCPTNRGYVLSMGDGGKNWTLFSNGPAVKIQDKDGNKILRQPQADNLESRIVSRSNLACTGVVGHNGVILF